MADNLRKFTTQEVLNKVYTDSSGITIGLNSQSSKETLNAVLDSSNNRLQVAMAGGTISGDVTISGDLTVEGNGSGTYDEIIQGNLALKEQDASGGSASLLYHDTDNALLWTIGVARNTNEIESGSANLDLVLASAYASNIIFANKTTESMRITSAGNVQSGNAGGWYLYNAAPSSTVPAYAFADDTDTGMGQDGANNLTFISGGSKKLQIDSSGATFSDDVNLTSSSSSDSKPLFQIINTDTNNNYGGELQFYKNAAAGSDNDQLGKILFYGNNDAGTPEKINFASIFAYSADVSNGSEDGYLRIRTLKGEVNTDTIAFKSGRVAVGHTSPSYNLDVQNAEGTYVAKFTAGWSSGSGIWVAAGLQGHGYGESTNLLRLDNQMSGGTRVFHIKSDGRVAINTAISNTYDMPTLEVRGETFTAVEYVTSSGDATVNLGGSRDDQKVVKVGYQVRGTGIADGSYVASVASNTQFELNQNAASSQADTDLTFSEPGTIKLSHPSTHIHSGNTIGKIDFEAPLEASGTDAILTGASIHAVAEANFTSSVNSTALVFSTGASEEAVERMRISSTGAISASPNADQTFEFGRTKITAKDSDYMYISHYDMSTGSNWAIRQNSSGGTQVNSASGQVLNFSIANSAKLTINADSRISLSNNDAGTANTVFGSLAGENLVSGAANNVYIGSTAGRQLNNAANDSNVAIGSAAMLGASSGTRTANKNIGIGTQALQNITTGASNVAVGDVAMLSITTGDNNVALGSGAATALTTANSTIFIGKNAGATVTVTNSTNSDGTIGIGLNALNALTSGAKNTAIGYEALKTAATESQSVAIGYQSMGNTSNGANNVMVGYSTGKNMTASNSDNTGVGFNALSGTHAGYSTGNTAIGAASMSGAINQAEYNTAVGKSSLAALTTGDYNVAVGSGAGDAITTDSRVVAIGTDSYSANDTTNGHDGTASNGSGNMAIGYKSMTALNDVNAFRNTMVGYETMLDCGSANASDNTALGFRALKSINNNSSDRNTAIGSSSLFALTTGTQNVAMGTSTGATMTTSSNTVLIGHNAGTAINDSAANGTIAIGSLAGSSITSGGLNTIVGNQAFQNGTTGANNVAIGNLALSTADGAESNNVAIGESAMLSVTGDTSEKNIAIGRLALTGGSGALIGNIAIGHLALDATGTNAHTGTIAIGHEALTFHTSIQNADEENTVIGYQGMWEARAAAGNVAVGYQALHEGRSTNSNTAVGFKSLYATRAGSDADVDTYNTAIGYKSGDGITSGIQCTALGANTAFDVDANNQTAVGYGATTDSANDIAIGNTSVDEVKGQVDFSTFSDKRIKTDIKDGDLGLDFINELKVRKFKKVNPAKYPDEIKKENDGKDVEGNEFEWTDAQADKVWDGLIAQEVKEAMDKSGTTFSGWSEESNSKQLVTYSTMVMPLIKAIQELSARVKELESK